MRSTSYMEGSATCDNVIGEPKGTISPDTILLVGGHPRCLGCRRRCPWWWIRLCAIHRRFEYLGWHRIQAAVYHKVCFCQWRKWPWGGNAWRSLRTEEGWFTWRHRKWCRRFLVKGFSFDADTSVFEKYYHTVSQRCCRCCWVMKHNLRPGFREPILVPRLKDCSLVLSPIHQTTFHHTRDVYENIKGAEDAIEQRVSDCQPQKWQTKTSSLFMQK